MGGAAHKAAQHATASVMHIVDSKKMPRRARKGSCEPDSSGPWAMHLRAHTHLIPRPAPDFGPSAVCSCATPASSRPVPSGPGSRRRSRPAGSQGAAGGPPRERHTLGQSLMRRSRAPPTAGLLAWSLARAFAAPPSPHLVLAEAREGAACRQRGPAVLHAGAARVYSAVLADDDSADLPAGHQGHLPLVGHEDLGGPQRPGCDG